MKAKVLITGAGSVIAVEVQKIISERENAEFFLTYNSQPLKETQGTAVYQVDLSDRTSLNNFCDKIIGAGITHYIQMQGNPFAAQSIETVDFENLEKTMDVNLNSSIMIIQSLIPAMKAQNFGRIALINTASSNHGGGLNSFSYGLAKHATGFLTSYLAKNYTSFNILSNCVSPGLIETGFHKKYQGKSDEEMQERKEFVPLKRAGTPKDVAEMLYHLTFKNEFISGENIKIDAADFI